MRHERSTGLFLASPYIVFFTIFWLIPIAAALVMVFLDWDLVTPPRYAGTENIELLLQDVRFGRALLNTLVFLAVNIPLQVALALALALALNRNIIMRSFWRGTFFLPVVISGAAVTVLWKALYSTDVGLLNQMLNAAGVRSVPWLTDPTLAMPAIAVMVTWKNVGFYIVLYLAGLQYVPRTCYEAMAIEGATPWQQFRNVTWPLLRPVTGLVTTLSVINGFQVFIEPYVMTGGGPLRRTLSPVLYMYKQAFGYQKMGYAATIGVALALIMAACLFVGRKLAAGKEAA